jgi:hypothetical protein
LALGQIAWLSHSIYSVSNVETRIFTIGKTSSAPQYVYAASPNLFDATLPGFLVIDKSDEGSGYSLSEQLYTPKGSQSALLGSLYQVVHILMWYISLCGTYPYVVHILMRHSCLSELPIEFRVHLRTLVIFPLVPLLPLFFTCLGILGA